MICPTPVSPTALEKHLRKLTEDIGVRLAGSPAEAAAADYLSGEFARTECTVEVETFPVSERAVEREELQVRIGGEWHTFPGSLFGSTPGTDGRVVEAPIVFFESATEYQRGDLSYLRDKAVVHLDCHIESRENYRRLMEAGPAFLLFVDIRYPGTVPLADGMFPAYVHALGAVPSVNVAFMDAWRWKVEGADTARLIVQGGMRRAQSQNIIAELPGNDPDAGILYAGGHHDTQAGSVGADDNGTGSTALLELARVLAPVPRRRTIRLISFGAEEQLSVGSATYVRQHRERVTTHGRFMFNMDSFGSHLGWTELNCCGPDEMADYLVSAFHANGNYVKATREVVPYADHFPFAAAGVPGIFLHRRNCAGGRFFHHRYDDDITRISFPLTASLVDCGAQLLAEFANADDLPFPRDMHPEQAETIQMFWEDLFGGWTGYEV